MHIIKINDGFPPTSKNEKRVTNSTRTHTHTHTHIYIYITFHNLELSAIMPNYGINLFIPNISLVIRTNVKFPNLPTRSCI